MPNLIDIIDDATRDLPEQTSPDITADFVAISQASDTTPKKVKLQNLVGSVLAALRSAFTPASSSAQASLKLHEDTDNGTNYIEVKPPASVTANRSHSLPDEADDILATQAYVAANAATVSGAATFTNKKYSFTPAHGTDDTYEGIQIPGLNNSGGVTQWDAVYLNGSSEWVLADANGSGTYPARGLAVSTETTGNPVTVLINGTVRNDAWNWTPGDTIYLSGTAGGLTQSQPATSGDKVQAVGYALTADIAYFDFNSFFFTVT